MRLIGTALHDFEREAQVLASLNHPNIAQIYGLEESNHTRCIVMELAEGPTLAESLRSGPLPIEDALLIAKQIAEALEAISAEAAIARRGNEVADWPQLSLDWLRVALR